MLNFEIYKKKTCHSIHCYYYFFFFTTKQKPYTTMKTNHIVWNLSDDHHPAPTFTPPELPKRVHVRGVTAGKTKTKTIMFASFFRCFFFFLRFSLLRFVVFWVFLRGFCQVCGIFSLNHPPPPRILHLSLSVYISSSISKNHSNHKLPPPSSTSFENRAFFRTFFCVSFSFTTTKKKTNIFIVLPPPPPPPPTHEIVLILPYLYFTAFTNSTRESYRIIEFWFVFLLHHFFDREFLKIYRFSMNLCQIRPFGTLKLCRRILRLSCRLYWFCPPHCLVIFTTSPYSTIRPRAYEMC